MNSLGALWPISQNNTATTANITASLPAGMGALGSPWPLPFLATGAAAGLAAAGGVAATLGAGAGQVMLPSLVTVRPRMASSSMLTLMMPSLVLHSSSVRRNRLVAYSVDDCL